MENQQTLRDRVVREFMTVVQIDSLSLKEQKMFEYLDERLRDLPVEMKFQKYSRDEIGAESGNLIVKIPANTDTPKRALFFDAHVDTVEPGIGIKPQIDGEVIRSDGTTVLGSDDKSGVAAMVIAIEEILSSGMEHGDVYFLFTSAEEIGLFGVMELDMSEINADFGFILDSHGDIGGIITAAPYHYLYDITVTGKASHAGIAPEKGLSAIKVAAGIVAELPQGRINEDTVANVGMIEGGKATNIVPDDCRINGEFRSQTEDEGMVLWKLVENAVDRFRKNAVNVDLKMREAYPGFNYSPDTEIIKLAKQACLEIGVTPRLEKTGGGSNTNIYVKNQIDSVTLASGMMEVHSTGEYIRIEDLENLTRLILKLIEIA